MNVALKFCSCYVVGCLSALLISSCAKPSATINPELFGSWSNDSGCSLRLAPESTRLIMLSYFSAGSQRAGEPPILQKVSLVVTKRSIFTQFKAQDPALKFQGSFSEGLITIDDYCNAALHKVTN